LRTCNHHWWGPLYGSENGMDPMFLFPQNTMTYGDTYHVSQTCSRDIKSFSIKFDMIRPSLSLPLETLQIRLDMLLYPQCNQS